METRRYSFIAYSMNALNMAVEYCVRSTYSTVLSIDQHGGDKCGCAYCQLPLFDVRHYAVNIVRSDRSSAIYRYTCYMEHNVRRLLLLLLLL